MPEVDTKHEMYQSRAGQWLRVRDAVEGEDAIKARGREYLPALGEQTNNEYTAYLKRASFHEATARTLDGLAGAIFRRDPVVELPEDMTEVVENFSLEGAPLETFVKQHVRDVISIGRAGVLVDMPTFGDAPLPYAVGYAAEDIINWRTAKIEGKPQLVLVVLHERRVEPLAADPFQLTTVDRWRVLQLGAIDDDPASPLVYMQTVWERADDAAAKAEDKFIIVEGPLFPNRRGEPFNFIPFMFFGPQDLTPDVQKPPLLGLTAVNISHYRTSADLEHGAHFTALPTAYVAGAIAGSGDEESSLRIGSAVAWMLEEGSQAGFLEYTGTGLGALEKRLERKEQHMAVLGARILEDQKKVGESADTVRLRHRGENSMLASISDTCSRGFRQVLVWMVEWVKGEGSAGDVQFTMNKDFVDRAMTPQEVVQLVGAWQAGAFGEEVLYHNLKEGERLPPDMDFEDWQVDKATSAPGNVMDGMGDDEFDDPEDPDAKKPPVEDEGDDG